MAQPPHDRTPRPSADKAPLIFPTIEAIEAAKNAAKAQKEPK
jgi:conjugal transfer pilus assembly protein TraV